MLLQNENGPCPLLALCNVLILTGRIKITPGQTDVSSTYLTDLLGTHLLELHKTNRLTDWEKANLEHNIQDTMAIFPKLQTGLDVNVKFNRYCDSRMITLGPLWDEVFSILKCSVSVQYTISVY